MDKPAKGLAMLRSEIMPFSEFLVVKSKLWNKKVYLF